MRDFTVKKEDYEEPCCPFTKPGSGSTIPVERVLRKEDEYLDKKDFSGAERHLLYWKTEAEEGGDFKGKLSVLNELIGLYRKTLQEEKCLDTLKEAVGLAKALKTEGSVTYGTTLLNAATGLKAFDRTEEALELYEEARRTYEKCLNPTDTRLSGLYNNMAVAFMDSGRFDGAEALYRKALEILKATPGNEPEQAVTFCNMADLIALKLGTEAGEKEIGACLSEAERLLKLPELPRDGYYAFVCEKCAPTFGYYGYFLTESELTEEAKRIYERI